MLSPAITSTENSRLSPENAAKFHFIPNSGSFTFDHPGRKTDDIDIYMQIANIKGQKTVAPDIFARFSVFKPELISINALGGLEKEDQATEIEANMFTFGIPPHRLEKTSADVLSQVTVQHRRTVACHQ